MASKSSHLVRFALAAMLVVPAAALGQVTAQMSASKVVVQDQKEVLASAAQAKPGDVIQYSVVYRNHDKAAAKNVMATLPVPKGMEFMPQTSSPAAVMASINGTDFAPVPLMRKVRRADGTLEQQQVPFSEYRFLRWNLGEMPAGAARTVSARMRIMATPAVNIAQR